MRAAFFLLTVLAVSLSAEAQVVQLPTVRTLGTQGTVIVPDGGGIQLGSVSRAAIGSSQRGVPIFGGPPRSVGGTISHAGLSAHATIIDLNELDRQILESPSRSTRPNSYTPYQRPTSFGSAMDLHHRGRGRTPVLW